MNKTEPKGFLQTCWYYVRVANHGMSHKNTDISRNIGWFIVGGMAFTSFFTVLINWAI